MPLIYLSGRCAGHDLCVRILTPRLLQLKYKERDRKKLSDRKLCSFIIKIDQKIVVNYVCVWMQVYVCYETMEVCDVSA